MERDDPQQRLRKVKEDVIKMRHSFALLLAFLLLFGSYGSAWWDNSWSERRPIILPPSDITKHTTLEVDWNAAFPLTEAQASLADLRIVDENTLTDLNRTCSGSYTGDGNCFFRMPRDWNAGYEGSDSQFYIYYGNGGASEKSDLELLAAPDFNAYGWEPDENFESFFGTPNVPINEARYMYCLLYTSPSPRDRS